MSPGQTTDLRTVLAQNGPLDPARAVDVVRQIAASVDEAHARGSVHRDIRPDTVLLSADGEARLADNAGPSRYRPPEVTSSEMSYHADIYALTGLLYECLTGSPPTPVSPPAPGAQPVMPPLLPGRPGPDIPPGFADVIARGMAENPRDRYGSARELVDAAQRALTSARADVPSSRLTTPAAAIFAGDTQTIQRGSTPAGSRPGPPPWEPGYGGSPTVTYPQSQPLPLPVGRPGRRHRIAAVVFAVAVVVAVVAGAAIAIPRLTGHTTTAPTPHTYTTEPAVLPFPGLDLPMSAAVDSSGALYVLASWAAASGEHDNAGHRLVVLPKAATSTTMKDLPGIDVRSATDVATDTAGNLYVSQDKSVWELAAGASRPIRLPFRGFVTIEAITVDAAGNIYAAGSVSTGGSTVKYAIRKLAPGDNKPTELPFTDLHLPRAVAVDKAGNVYVGDTIRGTGKGRIRRLAANTETPTSLSFPGLLEATRFAVDAAGELFVADAWQKKAGLFKLPAGSTTAAKVPISLRASAVAVDSGDNLYIATSATKDRNERIATPGQVVKLAPDR